MRRSTRKGTCNFGCNDLIPKVLPSMCVLVVKHDKDGKPNCAKSRIVCPWQLQGQTIFQIRALHPRSQILFSSSPYCQSSWQFTRPSAGRLQERLNFCNTTLPDDERMEIRSPIGNPGHNNDEYWLLHKTLYGLRRSHRHWYTMFTNILRDINLKLSPHNPCLFSDIVNDTDTKSTCHEIHVGAYVDDLVFCPTDPVEEEKI